MTESDVLERELDEPQVVRAPLRFDLDPPRRRSTDRPNLLIELSLVGCAIFLYFFVRGLTEGGVADAVAHAEQILRFERALGLDVELGLQQWVADHRWLVTGANWVYIWGHWPVIVATLVWLGRTRPADYRRLRNAMFVSGGIGLVIFALWPVAPPRLIDRPFVDTVTELSRSYRVMQPPALVNKYAAMPSLHVGWNFLVGVVVWRHARHRIVKWLGVLSPTLMIVAVVVTANHYVVDAVAGIALAVIGLVWTHRRPNRIGSRDDRAGSRKPPVVALVRRVAMAATSNGRRPHPTRSTRCTAGSRARRWAR